MGGASSGPPRSAPGSSRDVGGAASERLYRSAASHRAQREKQQREVLSQSNSDRPSPASRPHSSVSVEQRFSHVLSGGGAPGGGRGGMTGGIIGGITGGMPGGIGMPGRGGMPGIGG